MNSCLQLFFIKIHNFKYLRQQLINNSQKLITHVLEYRITSFHGEVLMENIYNICWCQQKSSNTQNKSIRYMGLLWYPLIFMSDGAFHAQHLKLVLWHVQHLSVWR